MRRRNFKGALLPALMKVIDDLVKTNEILAVTSVMNAKSITVEDSYKQEIIDREIAMAEEEIAKAHDEMAKERPGKAIIRFKLAWKHAQHAIFLGTGEPMISEREEISSLSSFPS